MRNLEVLRRVVTLCLVCPSLALSAGESASYSGPAAVAHDRLQASLAASAALVCGGGIGAGAGGMRVATAGAGSLLGDLSRRPLDGDVVEYSARVRVGTGVHDVIGIHRVVRELAPFVPRPSRHAVLMAHGDAWGFDAAFLANFAAAAPPAAADHALPVFLAANGIDVWGIDFRWTQVPATTTDFAFMESWGLTTDAGDLGAALAIARLTRLATGDGAQRIDLLGWSRGGQTSYAYLNAETELPAPLRQVSGFIPVDIFLKTDQPALQQAACARLAGEQATLAAGTFESATGTLFDALGTLAASAPGGASPVLAGLTNEQAALLAGAATYTLLPPGQAFVPFYHFVGGSFDVHGLPTGLTYTPAAAWFSFLSGASPFEPVKLLADADSILCGQTDLPTGDHLAKVTVPVLYVGAGGGFGSFGLYNLTLLGSRQVETHVVSLQTEADRALDIGHVDIFISTDAQNRFWQPILAWVATH
ncbi:MAG TPA: hypothetical protein VKY89_22700 [Thermoanaerobaculia bacterium]|nr:hypothetical protein [Thermoanaerobaculia bacterium]